MRLLIIGGTGLISGALAEHAIERGDDVTVVTRGMSTLPLAEGAHAIHADATDAQALRSVLRGRRLRHEGFDAVVQCVAYHPEHVRDDVETFAGLTGRYVLVSTAAAYRSFERLRPLTEDVEQDNPHWAYARLKAACESVLRSSAADAGLGYGIVRPAHTYGRSKIPAYTGYSRHPWTLVDRMRRGADILIPGDGTSVWTVTHASDVARGMRALLDVPAAAGEAVHITSDEALTWTGIYRLIAHAAGLSDADFERQAVCVPSAAMIAADPGAAGSILGDKMHGATYDTGKLRALVPGWRAQVSFADGIADAIAAFERNPAWQRIDAETNERCDVLGAIYREALRLAGDSRADAASEPV